MKSTLVLLVSFLSCVGSPVFAGLDTLLEPSSQGSKVLHVQNPEDFRVTHPQYQGISKLHPKQAPWGTNADYPKIPLIRPYTNEGGYLQVPFSAALYRAHAPAALENLHGQQLPNHTKVYSFIVQSMLDENTAVPNLHRLVPHYFVHAAAPGWFEGENYATSLKWTVVPGGKGQVTPNAIHQNAELLEDSITTHHYSPMVPIMLTSGNVMHLKGITHQHSVDLTSLVAFTDENNNNITAITYSWLLNDQNLNTFNQALENTSTLRELMTRLEPEEDFRDLLGELKRYVGFLPDAVEPQVPLQAPQSPDSEPMNVPAAVPTPVVTAPLPASPDTEPINVTASVGKRAKAQRAKVSLRRGAAVTKTMTSVRKRTTAAQTKTTVRKRAKVTKTNASVGKRTKAPKGKVLVRRRSKVTSLNLKPRAKQRKERKK